MATKVFAISQAVADESVVAPDAVIPLGNAHLGRWSSDFRVRREVIRGFHGWSSKFVVLNVCRFHAGEVLYKGVDKFSEVKAALDSFDPDFATRCVFVLCGKGDEADVDRMRALGLTVHANVSDEEMLDLYAAADIYMNFSRWEGYNLGIGQALAMGLNVIASDIPAHRAFGVDLVVDSVEASIILREKMQTEGVREARIWEWNHSINWFCNEVEALAHLN
jgi:glycosyltransferase involved in cell wall biosynthesis